MNMKQWEYKIDSKWASEDEFEDWLNELGEEGWELVNQEYSENTYTCTFKRKI